jgi:hypothetical protein
VLSELRRCSGDAAEGSIILSIVFAASSAYAVGAYYGRAKAAREGLAIIRTRIDEPW